MKKLKDLSTIDIIQQDVKLGEVDAGEEQNRVLGGANCLQDVFEVEGGGHEDKSVCFDDVALACQTYVGKKDVISIILI